MRKRMRVCLISLFTGVLGMAAGIGVVKAVMQNENQEKPRIVVSSTTAGQGVVIQEPVPPLQPMQPLLFPLPGGGLSYRGGIGSIQNSPFSGEMVFETIQTLADGNRVIHRSSTIMYRDSQGRTRQETIHKIPGIVNGENRERKTIQIYDPVAGHNYTIDPQSHTVVKFVNAARPIERRVIGASTGIAFNVGVPGEGGTANAGASGVSGTTNDRVPPGIAMASVTPGPPDRRSRFGANMEAKREQLGTQLMEGVDADGTRITHTIPAGSVGNERPIEVSTERWFSQELKMEVLVKTFDPRSGESIQRLTNINRSEPDPSLFEVPSDYTVREIQPPVLGQDEAGKIKLLRERGKPNDQ